MIAFIVFKLSSFSRPPMEYPRVKTFCKRLVGMPGDEIYNYRLVRQLLPPVVPAHELVDTMNDNKMDAKKDQKSIHENFSSFSRPPTGCLMSTTFASALKISGFSGLWTNSDEERVVRSAEDVERESFCEGRKEEDQQKGQQDSEGGRR
ncbi:hypothetical protein L596_014766 [Steinernema carpocapsae]|uniref:Uncharacterized protein n=1 Tax=Steinernema carpocapsae TaxID=34508 RepID=A0A4U5NDR2_STECR|nr:hypothetical protein L596_014766 [Steinernema carpocapsae]